MQEESYCEDFSFSMNTFLIQKVSSENGNLIIELVKNKIKQLEDSFNFFNASSEISRFNEIKDSEWFKCSGDLIEIITLSKNISFETKGAFDITAGCHKSSENKNSETVKINFRDLEIDYKLERIRKLKPELKIDLGAVAKGYACDIALKIYRKNFVRSALINFGGSVSAVGRKNDGSRWLSAIQEPYAEPGKYFAVIEIENCSISTSGMYRQDEHIINPETKTTSDSDLISASAVSNSATAADALSTAIFVMGSKDFKNKAQSFKDKASFIIVDRNKNIKMSRSLVNFFKISNHSYKISEILF